MKVQKLLTLDAEIVAELSLKKVNVSKLANDYFRSYLLIADDLIDSNSIREERLLMEAKITALKIKEDEAVNREKEKALKRAEKDEEAKKIKEEEDYKNFVKTREQYLLNLSSEQEKEYREGLKNNSWSSYNDYYENMLQNGRVFPSFQPIL